MLYILQEKLHELVPDKEEANLIATEENFTAGQMLTSEQAKFIDDCAVLVVAVSNSYINDAYFKMLVEDALSRKVPIVPIFIENITSDPLPSHIKVATRKCPEVKLLQEDRDFKIHPDWDTICKSIIRQSRKSN